MADARKADSAHTPDRRDVMPSEVMALHTQMPYPTDEYGALSEHAEYRQRHDARCYFCALLDALSNAEAERDRYKAALERMTNPPLVLAEDDATTVASWFVQQAQDALNGSSGSPHSDTLNP